jgi:hypothetical protein
MRRCANCLGKCTFEVYTYLTQGYVCDSQSSCGCDAKGDQAASPPTPTATAPKQPAPTPTKEVTSASFTLVQMGQAVEGPESVALSADGKIMATGAATADGAAGIQSVQVSIMQYDASTSQWEQLGQTIDGVTAGEQFGYSGALASDGLTMAAGAISSSDSGLPQSGNVRVLK